jgi:flagellar biosynthesis protein FlhG
MNDQAQGLRNLVQAQSLGDRGTTRIVTVTSGKGGVGKSNFTLNFALSLQAKGYKVLVFDADIGFSNIDVLMGVSPKYSLYHLLKKEKTIWDIIQQGHNGLEFIAGGSGFQDLIRLSDEDLEYFTEQVGQLNGYADFLIFDTGAGLSKETLKFILAAQETIVVTTPEPTSITDAYAVIKMVHAMDDDVRFQLVVNRVSDAAEGRQTANKISLVAKQFLQLDIPTLGFVSDDSSVSKAVKKQIPFSIAFPHSAASRSILDVANRFALGRPFGDGQNAKDALDAQNAKDTQNAQVQGGVKGFLSRMIRLMK